MDIDSWSVSTVDQYVSQSVRLATELEHSTQVRTTLAERTRLLFENQSEVDEYAAMLFSLLDS